MMLMLLRLAIYEAFMLLFFVDLGFPYYGGGFISLGIGMCFLGNGQRPQGNVLIKPIPTKVSTKQRRDFCRQNGFFVAC